MKVWNYLKETISDSGAAHLTLIDPDEQEAKKAGELAESAENAGTDGIMIGGSTKAGGKKLDETVNAIRKKTEIPIILFPADESGISRNADAIFFMSLLNSKDPFYITRIQSKGAPIVKELGIEPISLAYLIIEPGGAAGKVGKADLIERNDTKTAIGYSVAADLFGMKSVYLEAGSGAEKPVGTDMIKSVKQNIDTLLIVGGGIDSPEKARERVEAGADVIVTGTLIEKAENKAERISSLVQEIKE